MPQPQPTDERYRSSMEDKLREAALAVSSAEGPRIFEDLLEALASILDVEFALISVYVEPERSSLRTLATLFEGRIARNVEYPIAGTPCERAIGRAFGFFPTGVRSTFPDDAMLQQQAIEGYAACTLNDAHGHPIGMVAVMARRALSDPTLTEAMLKIFAARIAAEIERRNADEARRIADANARAVFDASKDGIERLRSSERQYRAIFESTADALVLRDEQFRIVDVNQAYLAMSGNTREQVIGVDVLTLNPAEMLPHVLELHRRALAGEPILFEAPARRRDGVRTEHEVRGVPIQHQGRPHVLYIGRDITERKASEAQLRESEQQYRAIFNAAVDSLVLRDAQFRVVDVNRAYQAMSGRSREEVLGRQDLTMSSPEKNRFVRELHERALAGEAVYFESAATRKNGERFEIEVRGVPILHRGEPHVLYIGRDVTARRNAEAEREQLEARLRQAQKMEAIGQLTGGIAHDFNNILQSILGNLVLAAEREAELGDARLARYLERARHSSQRARELIMQMLTFSRGQRGERRQASLPALARDVLQLLRSTLPATIELRTELGTELPSLPLDTVQIEQVLINLCINARDAMGGTGTLTVSARHTGKLRAVCASCRKKVKGRFVELSVRDTGPGITPQVLERMFEPFYSTKAVGKGSGMGLAIAHGIVHEHGGHIVVESGDAGTEFRVLLEASEAGAGTAPAAHAGSAAAPARSRPRLSGRVLVVDDEAMIREFMSDLLTGWGLEVVAVGDGVAARDALAADPSATDLVITDQTMPQLTGLALAAEVARIRPGMPVILYTGFGEDLSQKALDDAGVAALARKPIEPAQLLPLLRAHLPVR